MACACTCDSSLRGHMKILSRLSDYWPIVILALIPVVVFFYPEWQHWLSHATGSYNCPPSGCPGGSAHNYNAFSGSISDIGLYTIGVSGVANLTVVWKAHTCHLHWWCWRTAGYPLEGTDYKLCHVHHPDKKHGVKHAVRQYASNKAAS